MDRHLGLAGERCPDCGHEIETLLDNTGRNPLRLCWKCEYANAEIEAQRADARASLLRKPKGWA